MKVKLKTTRLMRGNRFCLTQYVAADKAQRGDKFFVITDADKVAPGTHSPGSAPIVFITPWYYEALAFMEKEGSKR